MLKLGAAVIDAQSDVVPALEQDIQSLLHSYSDVTKEADNPARSRGTRFDIVQQSVALVEIERHAVMQVAADQFNKEHPVCAYVQRSDGVKCPRCWKYNGIPDNHHGMCDDCARSLLETTAVDFMHNRTNGQTEDEFGAGYMNLQRQVMDASESQLEKYHPSESGL